jgi:hypothetical protein
MTGTFILKLYGILEVDHTRYDSAAYSNVVSLQLLLSSSKNNPSKFPI